MSKTAKNLASSILVRLDGTTESMIDAIIDSEVLTEPVPRHASLGDRLKYLIDIFNEHDPEVFGFDRSPYSYTSLDELVFEFYSMANDIRLIDADELREADANLADKISHVTGPINDLCSMLR